MNVLIEKLTGMDKLTDQVIATDFLVAAKSAVQNYAIAITETTTPQLRVTLINHLNDAISTHETVFQYMMRKGYYHAYDLQEQYQVDKKVTETALGLKEMTN